MAKSLIFLERETGFEPATFSLGSWHPNVSKAVLLSLDVSSAKYMYLTLLAICSILLSVCFTISLRLPSTKRMQNGCNGVSGQLKRMQNGCNKKGKRWSNFRTDTSVPWSRETRSIPSGRIEASRSKSCHQALKLSCTFLSLTSRRDTSTSVLTQAPRWPTQE